MPASNLLNYLGTSCDNRDSPADQLTEADPGVCGGVVSVCCNVLASIAHMGLNLNLACELPSTVL